MSKSRYCATYRVNEIIAILALLLHFRACCYIVQSTIRALLDTTADGKHCSCNRFAEQSNKRLSITVALQ